MELYAGMTLLVLIVAALIFFRSPIREIASYSEKIITVNCARGELELTKDVNEIMNELADIGPHRVEDLKDAFKSKRLGPDAQEPKAKK